MKKNLFIAAGAVLPLFGAAGCGDSWLTGTKLDDDPNRPTAASMDLLLNGIHAEQFLNLNGHLARVSTMYVQQFAGTDRQYRTLDRFSLVEDDFSGEFASVYTGGGLLDMRNIQDTARVRDDKLYLGIAQAWEGLVIGMAASIWGDIIYSEAVNIGTVEKPKLDEQQAVYAAVQTVLDSAIANLAANKGPGPGRADLVYQGSATKWSEAAWSLKARFYLHWVEAQRAGGASAQKAGIACGGDCAAKAAAAAGKGISTAANDFRSFFSAGVGEENPWFQFTFRERDSYVRGGRTLVDLLKARNDPRLAEYFRPGPSTATFIGAAPAAAVSGNHVVLSLTRGAPGFRQPVITWAETRLILAEASYYLGGQASAVAELNKVRAAVGLPASTATGAALLQAIAEEAYIELFQNIEAKNLYERTCYPNLALPTPTRSLNFIPGRFYYGVDERNANPNIPAPETPGNTLAGNDNDPPGGTVNSAATCIGQNYPSGG